MPPRKRFRSIHGVHASCLSSKELASLLKKLTGEEVAAQTIRQDLRTRALANHGTPYGTMLETIDLQRIASETDAGDVYQWEVINPFAFLFESCRVSPKFNQMLQQSVGDARGRLVFYTDGLTVGNELHHGQERESLAVYIGSACDTKSKIHLSSDMHGPCQLPGLT